MTQPSQRSSGRQITLLDCIGIGINGIIGTGIFLLAGKIWRQAGGLAPLSWLMTGVICSLVALCFAEAASRTEKSGGPYRYAYEAFGPYIGFTTGWVILLSFILGYAAVAKGLGQQLVCIDWIVSPLTRMLSIAPTKENLVKISNVFGGGVVSLFAIVNIVGVRMGAKTSSVTSAVKIVSLLLFVAVGFCFIKWGQFLSGPAPDLNPDTGQVETTGLWAAAFTALFAMTGVEYVSVPAGEVKNPQRTIPWALCISVLLVMVVYILVQIVAGTTVSSLSGSSNAIVDAARAFAGPLGQRAMEVAFLISAIGYCSGSALVGPRYLEVFAQDGFLPKALQARSAKFGTPVMATLVFSGLVLFFVQFADFAELADLSNIAVVIQYVSTCVAVLILRKKHAEKKAAFVIPGGALIPVLATVGCFAFLLGVRKNEWIVAGCAVLLGLLLSVTVRFNQNSVKGNNL